MSARSSDRRSRRPLSRRERLLEARREAARRAEIARRAAIARAIAIARARAAEQALRDETAANILLDDTTGEDMDVRRAAVTALGNRAGTVVVMDPKTGRVYTVVNQGWALRRGFKPCSTMKLITGLAGLCEQALTPAEMVRVEGGVHNAGLMDALARSVPNSYFQALGGRVGFDRMMKYARELGLGERTGINHANESAGAVPIYKTGYAVNHMSSHGDDFEVTPIQLATLTSAIANGGSLLVPHLPRTPEEEANFKTEVRRRVNVPQEMLRRLVPGMIGAVNYGSGKTAYDWTQTIAGKTGSCIGQGSWLGLFTSYAPVHDPRLTVVVVLRGSGARGRYGAAIAGDIYRSLHHRFGRKEGEPLAAARGTLIPRSIINSGNAAITGEDVAEEEAAAAAAAAANPDSTTSEEATPGGVRTVLKPVDTKPTEVTTKPSTPQPATGPPATTQPTTNQPATPQPAVPKGTQPTTTQPTGAQPTTSSTAQPAAPLPENVRPRRVLSTSP